MSSISSNTIGSYQDPEDQNQSGFNFPIEVPFQFKQQFNSSLKDQQFIKESVLRKFKWFICYFLKNYKFKASLREVNDKILQINEYKCMHGAKNCTKEVVKMKILLKHGSVQQCRQRLTNVITDTLLGQQIYEKD